MIDPSRTIGATDSTTILGRCLIAVYAVVVAGCGSGETEITDHDRCEDINVETYCEESGHCRPLEEQVNASEDLCDRGLDSFAHVVATGCGFTELRTVGPLTTGSRWFDTQTGTLVGFTWLSDTEPECNGTFLGSARPGDCDSVAVSECAVCGWDTCEWVACANEIRGCGWGFPCSYLWECSHETGCEGAECANAAVCPGFSLANAEPALQALDALMSCVKASGCSSQCPLSMRN